MTESKRRTLSVEEIFMTIRGDMGHTWPVGTFNQGEPIRPDTIEAKCKVLPDRPPKRLSSRSPVTRQPDDLTLEVLNG
ncbi:hypothetical protein A3E71_02945 [Candidatus Curtissbacteria bacterium RIFCSPHIGHO2_12_FULL_42_33]|nr:MAG: hypothetical protein A3E71_02945 [Candidatus Curtissbacteria bacterium RIFCSPHIGHO2_12_FULL_42_33]